MERFDVIFAQRYLDAFNAYRRGESPSTSWQLAFDAGTQWPPLVLQHLLLGMNAHINLDLGIAAASTAPGDQIHSLKGDFEEISKLLGELIDDVQDRISTISPWMWILDRVGARTDEVVCMFCMSKARDVAWQTAVSLALVAEQERAAEIERIDAIVTALGSLVRRPGALLAPALLLVRLREARDPARIIQALHGS